MSLSTALLQTNILVCCQERFQAKRNKAVSTIWLDVGLSSLQFVKSRYLELMVVVVVVVLVLVVVVVVVVMVVMVIEWWW